MILKSINIDLKVAKGECVHDPSAVRGRLSKREEVREGGREGWRDGEERRGERQKKGRVARGRSHLLVNKEGTERREGKKQENERKKETEKE